VLLQRAQPRPKQAYGWTVGAFEQAKSAEASMRPEDRSSLNPLGEATEEAEERRRLQQVFDAPNCSNALQKGGAYTAVEWLGWMLQGTINVPTSGFEKKV
jgi:hypothetical protein